MNKEQLKELVKQHFGLVDKTPVKEAFGEVFDENKAFKIVFPGDTLKVGDEVKVVTKEGQESLAPDGYHKLEDGTMIKTEGSSVVEIVSPEGKTEEEMSMEDGLGVVEDQANAAVEEAFAAKESISNVEGTTPQNAVTETNVPVSTLTGPVKTEAEVEAEMMKKVKMAIDETIASEIAGIKEEMKSMKTKMEEFMKSPAKDKTMMSADVKKDTFGGDSLKAKQMKVMAELLKNKK
jgi:rRNA-processing protein FCF1